MFPELEALDFKILASYIPVSRVLRGLVTGYISVI